MATITNITYDNGTGYVKAKLDGIQFNEINYLGLGGPMAYTLNGNAWAQRNPSKFEYAINAVDISWNGAILPHGDITNGSSKTINSTGELLKMIDDMQQEIYSLAAAVIAIGATV